MESLVKFLEDKITDKMSVDVISILNNAQREWLNKKKDFIDQQISKFYPLTDEQWQHVTDIVDDTVKKAKGHEAEVRKELFDLMEKWERKEKEGVRDE